MMQRYNFFPKRPNFFAKKDTHTRVQVSFSIQYRIAKEA